MSRMVNAVCPRVSCMRTVRKLPVCLKCLCMIGCCAVCRYHADLSTRGNRLQQLQDNYFKQQAVSPGPGRAPVMPLTAEQKDMVQAVQWYKGMGWEVDESGKQLTPYGMMHPERRAHSAAVWRPLWWLSGVSYVSVGSPRLTARRAARAAESCQ